MTAKVASNMTAKVDTAIADARAPFSAEEFKGLGGGAVAYVRAFRSEDIGRIFPEAPKIEPGLRIFALLGADGAPIMLTDSRETAIADAWERELTTVSLH